MRAVVHDRYGPPEVLRFEEVTRPVPHGDEVLVKIYTTTVTRADCDWRRADPFAVRFASGMVRPKNRVLGSELAGVVEAVGADVTEFSVGDRVFGVKAYLSDGFGCHAEYICIQQGRPLAHMPAGVTFEQAAAVCDGASTALAYLNAAHLRGGRSILIYGASGSIGTAAVQLARYFDADVTAVCNTKNVKLVRSLGADTVIDYLREDITSNGQTYDVILDAVGKQTFLRCRRSLKPHGLYLSAGGLLNPVLAILTSRTAGRRVRFPIPRYTKDGVLFLKGLIETGRYRAVIDRCYPFAQVVEATRYVETGQKTGNVVLTVCTDDTKPAPAG